jgi:hypothetical protein
MNESVFSVSSFLEFDAEAFGQLATELSGTEVMRAARELLTETSDGSWTATGAQLAAMAGEFMNVDLAEVAIQGWQRHAELVDAAERLLGTDAQAIVPLGSKNIQLSLDPRIEILFKGSKIAVLTFGIEVEIEVIEVDGVVRHGSLIALQGGHCGLTVKFFLEGVCLREKTAEFDPRRRIPLGKGVRLVRHKHRA